MRAEQEARDVRIERERLLWKLVASIADGECNDPLACAREAIRALGRPPEGV